MSTETRSEENKSSDLPPGEVDADQGQWMVTKLHNRSLNTVHFFLDEADAEFAAEAHYRTYHLRAFVAKVVRS